MNKKTWNFWKKMEFSDPERSASLLELFFDIVVVSLIGGIGHSLISLFENNQLSFFSIAFVVLQTISVLITWRIITMYSIKFETKDIRHKLIIFSVMIPMIVMAAMGYVEKKSWLSFYINGFAFMVLTFIVFLIFYVAALSNKSDKNQFWYLILKAFARLISFVIMLVSIIVKISLEKPNISTSGNTNNSPLWMKDMIGVWLCIILIQLSADIYSSRKKISEHMPKINRELIKERYSILYIAFLGEMTIQIISEFANNLSWENINYLFASIFQIFLMFWIYFELINYNDIKKTYKNVLSYSFVMLILFFSMIFISTGMSLIMLGMKRSAIILYLVGTLLYGVTYKIILLFLNPYNKKERYIQPKKLNRILTIVWVLILSISLALSTIYNSFNIIVWTNVSLQLLTVIINIYYIKKSKKKYLSLSDEDFIKILPKNKVDW